MVKVYSLLFILFFFFAHASAMITVSGRVTGTDDKPISVARVFLTYPSDDQPIKSVEVQKDGDFKIEIDSEGLWMLHFIGIYHHEYSIAVYANNAKEIKINVKLETYHYGNSFDGVKVVGNFNNWLVPRGIVMKKDSDGTYSAIVDSKTDTLFYRLVNARTDGEMEGTETDGFVPNGINGFSSFLIAKKGPVRIVFDPKKLKYSARPESFKFENLSSIQSKFAQAYATLVDGIHEFRISLYTHTANRQIVGFHFNYKPFIKKVKNLMRKERKGLVHQVLLLSYFELNYKNTNGTYENAITPRKLLKEIPSNSIVWSLYPHAILEMLSQGAFSEPEMDRIVHRILDSNPMARTKEILLADVIGRKFHSFQYSEILPYLSILLDQYGDSPEAIAFSKTYAITYIPLKLGKSAPLFSVKSLSDPSQRFNNNSFKGKFYLLSFWASSNKECIKEIEDIGNAYKKYKDKNLEILSISLDSSSQNVSKNKFIKLRMPWSNNISVKGFDSKICKDFEVYSIPKSILVDPSGNIVASGWDLREDNLDKTLAKYLGN